MDEEEKLERYSGGLDDISELAWWWSVREEEKSVAGRGEEEPQGKRVEGDKKSEQQCPEM
eukprot:759424-Hanusia_phi.AAC.4